MNPNDPVPSASPAAHLAGRFASDARALRARAEQLASAPAASPRGGARQPAGPDAAGCRAMADACDRVAALFASAEDEAALGALVPLLERVLADERSPDARHVYAGAVARLRQTLGDEEDDDEDEDDLDDDD